MELLTALPALPISFKLCTYSILGFQPLTLAGQHKQHNIYSIFKCKFSLFSSGTPFPAPKEDDWFGEGQKVLDNALKRKFNTNIAKNVILFIGDGMDITTITASRIYGGQKRGVSGEENKLTFEQFPNVAISKVRSPGTLFGK